jgi:hypothetical protein
VACKERERSIEVKGAGNGDKNVIARIYNGTLANIKNCRDPRASLASETDEKENQKMTPYNPLVDLLLQLKSSRYASDSPLRAQHREGSKKLKRRLP